VSNDGLGPPDEFAGDLADAQAEEVLDLRTCDQDGDAVGKSCDDWAREKLDDGAKAGESEDNQ
jgi:hypothetical protein